MGNDKNTSGVENKGPDGVELRKGKVKESIRIHFMFKGRKCKEPLKLNHTKQNIAYATRLRGEVLNAIERGTFEYHKFFPNSTFASKFGPAPITHSMGILMNAYMDLAKKTLTYSSYEGYLKVYEGHLKRWDAYLISDITPAMLRAWIGTLDCKLKTIRNILTPMRNVFDQAVNDDLIPANPLDRVILSKIIPREKRKSDYEVDPFDIEEITAILAVMEGSERNVWQFAFGTGMRTSEFIAFEWPSVDFIHFKASVDKVRIDNEKKEEAKTAAGLRKIDLVHGAYAALLDQKTRTFLAGGLVFLDDRYDPPEQWANDHVLRQRWKRHLTRAGVRYRNPYQTRHTFASTLLSAGANPLYVAKMMGHRDTEMVNRIYGRWIEQGIEPETRRKLADFFSPVSPKLLSLFPQAA